MDLKLKSFLLSLLLKTSFLTSVLLSKLSKKSSVDIDLFFSQTIFLYL